MPYSVHYVKPNYHLRPNALGQPSVWSPGCPPCFLSRDMSSLPPGSTWDLRPSEWVRRRMKYTRKYKPTVSNTAKMINPMQNSICRLPFPWAIQWANLPHAAARQCGSIAPPTITALVFPPRAPATPPVGRRRARGCSAPVSGGRGHGHTLPPGTCTSCSASG